MIDLPHKQMDVLFLALALCDITNHTLEAPIGLAFGQDKALYVIGKERSGLRRIDWVNRSISTLVRADGEALGLNTESGQLPRADGTEPDRPARIAPCRGIAVTPAGDLLVTSRLDDECSGGVVQITAPAPTLAGEAADAEGSGWDLDDGVLALLLGHGEAASDVGIPASVMQAAKTRLAAKPGFRPPTMAPPAAAAATVPGAPVLPAQALPDPGLPADAQADPAPVAAPQPAGAAAAVVPGPSAQAALPPPVPADADGAGAPQPGEAGVAAQLIPGLQEAVLAAAAAAGIPAAADQPVAAPPVEAAEDPVPDLPLELMAESVALPCAVL